MNLAEVSAFEVRRNIPQEVEYFDNGLIRELWQWNAVGAVIGAHGFPQ